jgi:hypothetical protein
LPITALAHPDVLLAQLAQRTGHWHHQIRENGSLLHFALSAPHGPESEDWTLLAVFSSPVAARLATAIAWADGNPPDDFEDLKVRLLIVPAYQIHALWLTGDAKDRIVIADMPALRALKYETSYSGREFLEALSQETPVSGTRL